MDSDLKNKVAIITGASGGIGSAITRTFAEEGAKVAIHYNSNQESAKQLATEFDSLNCKTIAADLRVESDVEKLFQQTKESLGTPEILIANAGYWPRPHVPIHEMSLERWGETISVNLTSVFLCVREFLKLAKDDGQTSPAIVMIGSTAGDVGEAGHGDYATGKSAFMSGMMNSLKNEITRFARHGRVNTVCPGWTLTPMADKLTSDKSAMVRALQTIPLRKCATPEDIANAVTFLASNKLAGHITGQCLFVSGGMEGRVINSVDEIDLG